MTGSVSLHGLEDDVRAQGTWHGGAEQVDKQSTF